MATELPPEQVALHASAPDGCRCADCTIDKEPCPDCYTAWWTKRHPYTLRVGLQPAPAREPSAAEEEALMVSISLEEWAEKNPDLLIKHAKEVIDRLRAENADLRYDNTRLVKQASELATENGREVWCVQGRTFCTLFATQDLAIAHVSSFPASIGGGMSITGMQVLATSERDQRGALPGNGDGAINAGSGNGADRKSDLPPPSAPHHETAAKLAGIALGIEAAREVAYMHASDCAALGYSEKARTAATIVDLIEALQSAEVLAKNPTEVKP